MVACAVRMDVLGKRLGVEEEDPFRPVPDGSGRVEGAEVGVCAREAEGGAVVQTCGDEEV